MACSLARTLIEGDSPLASVEDGIRACVTAFGIDQAVDQGRVIDLGPMWDAVAMPASISL
jgi:hypothetical protein